MKLNALLVHRKMQYNLKMLTIHFYSYLSTKSMRPSSTRHRSAHRRSNLVRTRCTDRLPPRIDHEHMSPLCSDHNDHRESIRDNFDPYWT